MRTLFFIAFLSISNFVFSQKDTIELKQVLDTTFLYDSRLDFLKNRVLPAIAENIQFELDRQRISTGEATKVKESHEVYSKISKAISEYSFCFMKVDTLLVNPHEIENEFNELNLKIENLQNDKDIKYLDAINEFKTIQDRQSKLLNYWNQLNTEKK